MKRSNAVWILLLCLTVLAATGRNFDVSVRASSNSLSVGPVSLIAQSIDISAPDVVFLNPKDSTVTENGTVLLRVLARSRIPLIGIVLDVNGDVQKFRVDSSTVDRNRYIFERKIELRSGKNRIAVTASNEKARSLPAVITLVYEPIKPGKPNLYVLAIGVSKGEDSRLTAKTAARDAEAFARLMSTQKSEAGLFGNVEIRVLINEEATREAILNGLDWLREQKKFDNDLGMLFLSGNLAIDYNDNSIYFLTAKYQPKVNLVVSNIRYSLFWEYLSSARGMTVIFANTGWGNEGGRYWFERFPDFSEKGNLNSFFSARDGVAPPIVEPLEHSTFTLALLEGLKGAADFGLLDGAKDGIIDTYELQLWLKQKIYVSTKGRQVPLMQLQARPLPIFKLEPVVR